MLLYILYYINTIKEKATAICRHAEVHFYCLTRIFVSVHYIRCFIYLMFRNVCKLLHKVQNQLLVRNYLQLRINSLQQDSVQTARAARDHHKKI